MKYKKIILPCVWVFVVVSFLCTPLNINDFSCFWAYAKQVNASSSNGMDAIVSVFEIKGLLYKIISYVEYVFVSPIENNLSLRGIFYYKLFGLIAVLGIIGVFVVSLPGTFLLNKNRLSIFFIVSILLLMTNNVHLQPEMYGCVLMLWAFALYLHDSVYLKILAGVIFALTFYLKAPMPLLGGSIFFGAMLLKNKTFKETLIEILPFAFSAFIFMSITLFALYRFYPQVITDMWDSSYYQPTLFHTNNFVYSLDRMMFRSVVCGCQNFTIALGYISSILLLFKWIKERIYSKSIFLALVWMFPLLYVYIQNNFFPYHFYLCSFAGILSLYLFLKEEIMPQWSIKLLNIFVVLFFSFLTISSSFVSPIVIKQKKEYSQTWKKIREQQNYSPGCKLGNGEVLFLDGGIGAYIFDNNTYLRWFYPLPLQRIPEHHPFTQTATYKQAMDMVKNYTGQYITLHEEFFYTNNKHNDIKTKILTEYEYVDIINVPCSFKNSFKTPIIFCELKIYKRKGT